MSAKDPRRLPERDPVSQAVVGIGFLLLIGWFVWSLLSPPVLRMRPELRAEPIPRDFGLVERIPRRPGVPEGRSIPRAFEGTRPAPREDTLRMPPMRR
jgi:hypothetical protein